MSAELHLVARPEPRWIGFCHYCRRFDVEVQTRYDHGARTLCDRCYGSRPPTTPVPVVGDVAKRGERGADVAKRDQEGACSQEGAVAKRKQEGQEGQEESRGVRSEEEGNRDGPLLTENRNPLLATSQTAAVEWLRRRAGRVEVPTPRHAVAACIHRLVEHEAGERLLDIMPLVLPEGAGRPVVRAAEAFVEWEAARGALDAFAGDSRVVLSDRLWAALAGLERVQVYRAKRWMLARGVLVEDRPEPSSWEGRPTGAYRRGESAR